MPGVGVSAGGGNVSVGRATAVLVGGALVGGWGSGVGVFVLSTRTVAVAEGMSVVVGVAVAGGVAVGVGVGVPVGTSNVKGNFASTRMGSNSGV